MLDLHRHDDYSLFDGLGKPIEMARLAKEYGYTALASSNHGTPSGMVEHYLACKEVGIKPILGVEVYFMPTFDRENITKKKRYHLCLFCKNLKGYQNLNRMLSYANMKQFYYKPIVTFELLEKYHEGLICTSACVAGYPSQAIVKGRDDIAKKALEKFKDIFGRNFFVEIQPYKINEDGQQERINETLMELTDQLLIPCILTSDSHYGRKSDFDTFLTMHMMKAPKGREEAHRAWVCSTYGERYMPEVGDLRKRFLKMHRNFHTNSIKERCKEYCHNLELIEEMVEPDIFSGLKQELPRFDDGSGRSSEAILRHNIKEGLKSRGKYNKAYWDRCMQEFEVIKHHGFHDYFLIVQDYVMWAKKQGIAVGPGRGSACNCEVAYALGITDVDAIYFGLDFQRFLRKDKKKLPDIDIDFETSRRQEVIDYIIKKYKGKAIQICSYGMFKIDNLLNDLFKICGVTEKENQTAIKKYVNKNLTPETKEFDYEVIRYNDQTKAINSKYNNLLKHFSKMYKKVKYIGTHAAGVAIVGTNIFDYVSVEKHGDKFSSAYDLNNLEAINAIKFDMLGLRTMSIVRELQEVTGEIPDDSWLEDKKVFKEFRKGNTEGIFQFEKAQAVNILVDMKADSINDVIAANALNRPGPLSLRMPEQYAHNKQNYKDVRKSPYYKYTKDTYGTIVYQEQIAAICINIGNMEWAQVDKILKLVKSRADVDRLSGPKQEIQALQDAFVEGAVSNGLKKKDAIELFEKLITYSFNKGHATGYAIIATWLMWYKVYYPLEFWYICLKYARDENEEFLFKRQVIQSGNVVLTPHINGTARYSLRKVDGEICVQEGLVNIKGVGEKAAFAIEAERKANGKFKDIDDLTDRLPKQIVNARVLTALKAAGACQMDKNKYFSNVVKICSSIISR